MGKILAIISVKNANGMQKIGNLTKISKIWFLGFKNYPQSQSFWSWPWSW